MTILRPERNATNSSTSGTVPSTSNSFEYKGFDARTSSSGTNGNKTFRRAGIGVLSSVMSDGTKDYTPGVSSREGGVSTFQHSGLKNALDQTDSSETVTASRHYDAFGNVIDSSGAWEGPFGYAGSFGYQEDGNGLKLLGHRYYDPDTGRFLTSDLSGFGSNWYVYVGNEPVSYLDPLGLQRRGFKQWFKDQWSGFKGWLGFGGAEVVEEGIIKPVVGGRGGVGTTGGAVAGGLSIALAISDINEHGLKNYDRFYEMRTDDSSVSWLAMRPDDPGARGRREGPFGRPDWDTRPRDIYDPDK